MNSISGINSLAQILFDFGSGAVSSPTVQSALQNAPSGDVVQLSDQAVQLQEAEGLFGTVASSLSADLSSTLSAAAGSGTSVDNLLSSALQTSLLGSDNSLTYSPSASSTASSNTADDSLDTGSSSSSDSSSPLSPLAAYQASLLSQETQALFGTQLGAGSAANALSLLA